MQIIHNTKSLTATRHLLIFLLNRNKNILLSLLLLLSSPFLIGNGLDNPSIEKTVFHSTFPDTIVVSDSLKLSAFACNFTPSLWLKADEGITLAGSNVSSWVDQSGNTNNAIQNTNNARPSYQDVTINFNPALDFDGSNDYLQGNAGGANTTLFMVARSDLAVSRTTAGQTLFTANIVNPNSDAYFLSLGSATAAFNNEVITHALGSSAEYRKALTGNTIIPALPHLYSTSHNSTNSTAAIYYDGTKIDNNSSGNFINPEVNRPYRIGGNLYVWGGDYFNGQMAEVLSFPTNLGINDRQIIESYLGIKYGISLTHAYQDTDGQTVWNEANYPNNITSIARDDCFNLNQKQSKSSNTGGIITMGLGTIVNSNADNTNNFTADKSFLFWGNDNDNNGTIEETTNEVPSGIEKRLDREWKIRNINSVGEVEVQFDLTSVTHSATDANDLFLLIDEDGDGDFTNGTVQQIAATSFSNDVVSFSNISFRDGMVISLATALTPNNAPEIKCPTSSIDLCPNGVTSEFAMAIQVADLDNDNLSSSITITGVTDNLDEIAVDLTGFPGINQAFNYPILQITGTITPTQLQTVLQTLQFSTTSTLAGVRTIRIIVNDGIINSNEVIKEIQADENLSICCSANAPLISN